ncbi:MULTISPECIES: hypothetical protein [unclassified Streptomyces]|uniref:hypothetical protein n=1 Tax=unclassified Streptomyces TaxID=2593676 RepID=UPI002E29FF2A|nr:hypothetical protein [Streptomyces sp. NBC_00223]
MNESLKPLADRLARVLATEDGADLARLLETLWPSLTRAGHDTAARAPGAETGAKAAGADGVRRVGIWRAEDGGRATAWVRDEALRDQWRHWASVGRLPAKGTRRRVVLIGESVARGYLYDPAYTPAGVLAAVLDAARPDEFEVIDLARTSLGLEVDGLALAAESLEPDAVVVFGGNNWRWTASGEASEAALLAAALDADGIPGYRDHAHRTLRERAERTVAAISARYAAKGVPVLWIVPEFGLADWQDPLTGASHLPGDGNARWRAHHGRGLAAAAAGDPAAAAQEAHAMLALDRGTGAAAHRLLADAALAAGDPAAARGHLEAARDAYVWDPAVTAAPRCPTLVQDAIRDTAARHGADVLDCRELFAAHTGETVPGSRLFLDYCHLTSEGIRVVMAGAAAFLLRSPSGPDRSWPGLLVLAPLPSVAAEAEARFLAAVHNAHWWQPRERVGALLAEAVLLSDHLEPVLTAFLDLQATRAPKLLCPAAEDLLEYGSDQLHHYLFGYGHQQLDPLLSDAITEVLAGVGTDLEPELDRQRIEEHSAARQEVDLLDHYYCSAARQPYETEWLLPSPTRHDRDFYQAFGARSDFVFVTERAEPVRLALTCRLPYPAGPGAEVTVLLNGDPLASAPCDDTWAAFDLELSAGTTAEGLNTLTLEWPVPAFPGRHGLDAMARDVLKGRLPAPYCPFGEVHTLTAGPAAPRAGRGGRESD